MNFDNNFNQTKIKKSSINGVLEEKIQKSIKKDYHDVVIEDENQEEDYEIEKLERELILKSKNNLSSYPKNYGNMWSDEHRKKILKYLKKKDFDSSHGLFDESNISEIAKKLERTEFGIKEEIKKMIFNEYIEGKNHKEISEIFNIPEPNIKLVLKFHIEKNHKRIINQMETENKIFKLKIENLKLKKELRELNK